MPLLNLKEPTISVNVLCIRWTCKRSEIYDLLHRGALSTLRQKSPFHKWDRIPLAEVEVIETDGEQSA